MSLRRAMVATLLGLLTACSSADSMLNGAESYDDADTGAAELPQALRIDVYPSDDGANDLEPQSLWLDGDSWTNLDLQIEPSVRLEGVVQGFIATPYFADPTVPGSDDQPIAARIDVVLDDSIAGGSTTTTETGAFWLTVPPGRDYRVEIIPEENDSVPFDVLSIPVLASDLDLGQLYLDYGSPVWGQVAYSDGTVPQGARVQLVDAETGAAGPTSRADVDGWFLLRAYPGEYELRVQGRTGGSDPTLSIPLSIESDEGARVDVDMGPSQRQPLSGRLVDEQGQTLSSASGTEIQVRATSRNLRDVDGSLVTQTQTNSGGLFYLPLPPGDWLLEFIPPYDEGLSPQAIELTLGDTTLDIGDVVLQQSVGLTTLVEYGPGAPATNVLVVAREVGFDGYTYSGTTGVDGRISFDVPRAPLEVTVTPPDDSSAITRISLDPSEDRQPRIELDRGVPVSGQLTSQGTPVPFALVEVRSAEGQLYGTAITDLDGRFSMRVPDSPSEVED